MIFDDSRDNGYVQIRRNLLNHLQDGRMTPAEYWTFHVLLLTASTSTGEARTCASAISLALAGSINKRAAQRALQGLETKGYISRTRQGGERGIYTVLLHGFVLTTGPQAGQRTGVSARRVASGWSQAGHELVSGWCRVGTESGTHRAPITPLLSGGYGQDNRELGTEDGTELVRSWREVGSVPTPIQEAYREGEGKEQRSMLPDFSPPRPNTGDGKDGATFATAHSAPTKSGPPPTATGEQAGTPLAIASFIPANPDGNAESIPVDTSPGAVMRRHLHPLQITDEDFSALDFAFTHEGPFNSIPLKEFQRAIYYHWVIVPASHRYWANPKKGNITSVARLTQAIVKIVEQVPADFKIRLNPEVKIWNYSCETCGGTGAVEEPAPGYNPSFGFTSTRPCGCMSLHPAPWRFSPSEFSAQPGAA